jgi:acyl carrier protein
MITDEDFLRLFNACAVLAKTPNNPPVPAGSLDDLLPDLNIDSLDTLVLGMYVCDVFQVPEEVGKTMQVKSVGDLKAFLLAHATIELLDVDKAIESLQ